MSSSNTPITDIICNGLTSITYTGGSSKVVWTDYSEERACHTWLEEAYPEIFAEFKAVHDVSK